MSAQARNYQYEKVCVFDLPAGFTWSVSLVETTNPVVNMIEVINKEARAT